MATDYPPPPPVVVTNDSVSDRPRRSTEIKIVGHSFLLYWWPVWLLAFFMAFVTWAEGNRLAIVPGGTQVEKVTEDPEQSQFVMRVSVPNRQKRSAIREAANVTDYNAQQGLKNNPAFTTRISGKSWPGGIFVTVLILTIIVTNVPLRGLWSFVVIICVIVVALFLALLDLWDNVFQMLGNLHIHINMAGYLTIAVILFIIWALAVFFFDRRTYVIFTPGQIQVCEHIGDSVRSFPTQSVSLEKQRDDLFRHYIFGLGSGDLIVKIAGTERHEIRMPNVMFLGLRLNKLEEMLRTLPTT